MDILFPLASVSATDNLELRFALRSIYAHAENVGRIWIATDNVPKWIRTDADRIRILKVSDRHRHCKDANLFEKVLAYCRDRDSAEDFLFWSDDQCLMRPFDLAKTEPTKRMRELDDFDITNKWQNRLQRTMRLAATHGIRPDHHCETHIPQPHKRLDVLRAMAGIDYWTPPGYTINTFIYGRAGIVPAVLMGSVKRTFERPEDAGQPFDRRWIGYNDVGFNTGLRERLAAWFPTPSPWEIRKVC